MTNKYLSFDGRPATLADLIAHLRYVSADLDAAAAADVVSDPVAAQGLARVIEHHCRTLEAELVAEPERVARKA